MNPAVLFILACIVCSVLVALVTVAYGVLNKPVTEKPSLIPASVINDLLQQQRDITGGINYTNVWNTQIGFDSSIIIGTYPALTPESCKSMCGGTQTCKGFQIRSDGTTCDILNSNLASTYGFTTPGYNYYQQTRYTPDKIVVTGISNQDGGGAQVGTSVPVSSMQQCGTYCYSNTECDAFSVKSATCKLWQTTKTGYSAYAQPGSTLFTLSPAHASVSVFGSTSQ